MGPKIAIIGGGIGGLTAAVALARKGLAAEVYEQAPVLEEVGAGVGLWPNALTALAPIGLADKVAQLTVKLDGQGIKRPDGAWLLRIPGEVMAQRWGAGPVLVHRAELQQLLAAELGPSVIHLGARCTGFEDSGQAVTAYFADGRKVQADVLVGADGVHSVVRAQLFGPAALRYRGYTAGRVLSPGRGPPVSRWSPGHSPCSGLRQLPLGAVPRRRPAVSRAAHAHRMMHGCGDRDDHGKPRNDHGSRVTKQPIKIRNEKRTKRT